MTPAHCRAARGFLGWTRFELAGAASVSGDTIKCFETEQRTLRQASLREIRTAFESAGIALIDENGEGPGIAARTSNWSAQCRAARGLLGWTHSDVAAVSGVSDKTVMRLEGEQGALRRASLRVIRRALEAAGVIFVEENHGGACVRLRKLK